MDMIYLALYALGFLGFIMVGTKVLTTLFRLADKAHRLAWIPLAGLLVTLPVTLGL